MSRSRSDLDETTRSKLTEVFTSYVKKKRSSSRSFNERYMKLKVIPKTPEYYLMWYEDLDNTVEKGFLELTSGMTVTYKQDTNEIQILKNSRLVFSFKTLDTGQTTAIENGKQWIIIIECMFFVMNEKNIEATLEKFLKSFNKLYVINDLETKDSDDYGKIRSSPYNEYAYKQKAWEALANAHMGNGIVNEWLDESKMVGEMTHAMNKAKKWNKDRHNMTELSDWMAVPAWEGKVSYMHKPTGSISENIPTENELTGPQSIDHLRRFPEDKTIITRWRNAFDDPNALNVIREQAKTFREKTKDDTLLYEKLREKMRAAATEEVAPGEAVTGVAATGVADEAEAETVAEGLEAGKMRAEEWNKNPSHKSLLFDWKAVPSNSRPGQLSYEHTLTGFIFSWEPKQNFLTREHIDIMLRDGNPKDQDIIERWRIAQEECENSFNKAREWMKSRAPGGVAVATVPEEGEGEEGGEGGEHEGGYKKHKSRRHKSRKHRTRRHKSRKHKSRRHKSRRHKSRRHKSRRHKSRRHRTRKHR